MEAAQVIKVMDQMPYGLYIVGSAADGDINGMMADWVMQVSFEPRLLAVSFENDAHTLENIRASRAFTVNLLSQEEPGMELASRFAQPYYGTKVKGRTGAVATEVHHKLEGIPYTKTASGCPVLEAAMGWLECSVEEFVPAGDHTIVIGEVVDGRLVREAEPLTSSYTGWNYSG
ncbi:MAG: flavin reductase [Chloroflexi bacterium]|nr:flavin reductase [Chloroflexota bacterium]